MSKSSLIKMLSGAVVPDDGEIEVGGRPVRFTTPVDARAAGIETVYQTLAVAPSLDIASNLFLGRETRRRGVLGRWLRMLDHTAMRDEAARHLDDLGIMTIQSPTQAVETLSGGQRQARAVLDLILEVRACGLSLILVSHDMPQVFEIADRIHIQRLGRRIGVVTPASHSMTDVVAIMTGAAPPPQGTASP